MHFKLVSKGLISKRGTFSQYAKCRSSTILPVPEPGGHAQSQRVTVEPAISRE